MNAWLLAFYTNQPYVFIHNYRSRYIFHSLYLSIHAFPNVNVRWNQVLGDPQSHAGQVHPERYKAPIHLEQSQRWRPNHSAYRDEALSSLRADKGVCGEAAQGDSYSHVHVDSHVEPLQTSSLVVGDSDPPLKQRRLRGPLSKGTQ